MQECCAWSLYSLQRSCFKPRDDRVLCIISLASCPTLENDSQLTDWTQLSCILANLVHIVPRSKNLSRIYWAHRYLRAALNRGTMGVIGEWRLKFEGLIAEWKLHIVLKWSWLIAEWRLRGPSSPISARWMHHIQCCSFLACTGNTKHAV